MKVTNIHKRSLASSPDRVGALIDSLASSQDALWPVFSWPRMEFDRPLGIGARGGHGPVRYYVEKYVSGRCVKFRFTGPRGFDGFHSYECIGESGMVQLRHTLEMNTHGIAMLSWPLIFRPLHDALVEDSLTRAELSLGLPLHVRPWSFRVRVLRWLLSRGKASRQGAQFGR